mgnify:CR=1 FL=1
MFRLDKMLVFIEDTDHKTPPYFSKIPDKLGLAYLQAVSQQRIDP